MIGLSAWSLLPIIITLVVSLWTRKVVLGLFYGVVTGVLMLQDSFNPLALIGGLVQFHLVPQVMDSYNAGVLVLLVFIGGFVALMEQSGGGHAFAERVTTWVKSQWQVQIASWFGGIVIFFSDLGTPLIIGPVFRPLFDKLKVSRQKLAFIVDSTASPVAILVPFIGWGVYIMGLIRKELVLYRPELTEWDAFVGAIPFQFYALLAVIVVPVLAIHKMDFGPMAQADRHVQQGTPQGYTQVSVSSFSHPNAKASFVWAPLLVMLAVILLMLVPQGFPLQQVSGAAFRAALASGYFFAATTLILLMAYHRVRKLIEGINLYLQGMNNMMQIAIVLILAWTLSALGKELGTAAYIADVAKAGFPAWLLPAATFLIAAIISFATGSSWGTFAIMMPLVLPTAFAIDAPLLVCIGAVLSGGLFGDHCSPISETTVFASTGAGCDQYEHFRTQLPYALMNGVLALAGFVMSGAYPTPYVLLLVLALQLIVLTLHAKWNSPAAG
ncbi:sodium:proton exchanger [Shewanella avicenniae]|uniref:Sodium:proton exchanger n=1 Tax=Shewanella avicenniae TaxID=2814294 RepID=A0ABX7QW81_9GAMM|nr:Na+/H+ antiporter NhaC family protein [Shewanella avicenniae]QSX35287.1 sodium:proton exchanger [Shewanella avicenniae]